MARTCLRHNCGAPLDDGDSYPLDICTVHRESDDVMDKELTIEELKEILGKTIKADDNNKVITFLGMLTAYTGDSQINISFRAPSSSGKSYIPLEIANLFPKEDVTEIAYSSPTAFFHDKGEWDKENATLKINLERKLLIFVDMPHDEFLHRIRPVLSHDRRELVFKITDKSERKGMRTKNAILRGYPAVVFCTASAKMDEQESTRNIVLSPETTQEKLREAIMLRIRKESNPNEYRAEIDTDPIRESLKKRIRLVRAFHIEDIVIPDSHLIIERFLNRKLKPRHNRDVGRLMSIIKAIALLNIMHRKRDGKTLFCLDKDIEAGMKIWEEIERSQEFGIPPYILTIYEEVVLPLANGVNNIGINRRAIAEKYFQVYGRFIPEYQLRKEILMALQAAGLIYEEANPEDKRQMLIYITTPPSSPTYLSNNMNNGSGVCYLHKDRPSVSQVKDKYKTGTILGLCKECNDENFDAKIELR